MGSQPASRTQVQLCPYINKLLKTMISWQQLRILLLVFIFGGVLFVLFQVILAPPSEKPAAELQTKTK